MIRTLTRSIAPAVATCLVVGGLGLGLASAEDEDPDTNTPGAAAGSGSGAISAVEADLVAAAGLEGRRPGARGVLGRAVHGDVIVRTPDGGGYEEVTFDKGTVTEVSDAAITLERPDGVTVTLELTEDTEVHGGDGAGVVTDRPAMVVSVDGVARHVLQRPAEGDGGPGSEAAARRRAAVRDRLNDLRGGEGGVGDLPPAALDRIFGGGV